MSLNRYLFLFIFLFNGFNVFAQEQEADKTFETELKKADALFQKKSYFSAVSSYAALAEKQAKNEYVAYRLAYTFYHLKDYPKAKTAFERMIALKGKKTTYPAAYFYYGQTLKTLGAYEQAQDAFLLFMQASRRNPDPEIRSLKKRIKTEIKSCDYALELEKDHQRYIIEVEKLEGSVNTGYSDFSPISITEDSILFASMYANEVISLEEGAVHKPVVKLYQSRRTEDSWEQVQEAEPFNDPLAHTANGVFTDDGKTFYFSRCYDNEKQEKNCDLFVSHFKKGKWQKPKKLSRKINTKKYSVSQPAIGKARIRRENYTVLYFVSNRPGGRGGKDIWYALINEKGKVTGIRNCGSGVNTKGDEVSPFYDAEQQFLYFSSNGHMGAGGFDIFKAEGYAHKFRRPVNVGIPLNSAYDDLYFSLKKGQQSGFLVSNRPGSTDLEGYNCCEDIYSFQYVAPDNYTISGKWAEHPQDSSAHMKVGIIANNLLQEKTFLADSLSKADQEQIQWVTTADSLGQFNFAMDMDKPYTIVAWKEKYKPQFISLDSITTLSDQNSLNLTVELEELQAKPIRTIETFVPVSRKKLSAQTTIDEIKKETVLILENIYFDVDRYSIKKESIPTLKILLAFLQNNPEVRIEIAGHTDNKGDNAYNLELSLNRAKEIKSYLLANGIADGRIIAKGFGEESPIALNEHPDGSDNPDGRKLNRRIEIKILK